MVAMEPLDPLVPITQQLNAIVSPVVLINIFTVDAADVDALLDAWEHDANWMKKQPGYISTQLHRGIAGSCTFLNYAIWESVEHFRTAFTSPEFSNSLAAYPSSTIARPHLFSRVAMPNLCTS
ncbi:antibiotic biosynthesis monooxygenase family protein [Pseudomonas sp. PGPR40]|uniref:antibiotic biosynthesis monooxygenase family protein n=1 Tax=Pseudomonas sp. PGPR40 TaxID=2913476 RepID=UPI001ED9FE00|nr:antibiotic biosynthesis monooxygenase family protein [Pseudomonas sp. PGPR40]